MEGATLPKPLWGDPCNGCGLCCLMSQCPLSVALFGQRTRCPALIEQGGGKYGCGLSNTSAYFQTEDREEPLKEAVSLAIGSGFGCDMTYHAKDHIARARRRPKLLKIAKRRLKALSPMARKIFDAFRGVS